MRVLLVGEYSGVHNALREGLRHLGVEATLASHGDGWKGFPTDIGFGVFRNRWLNVPFRLALPFLQLGRMSGFDVVQFINAYSFFPLTAANAWLTRRVIECNGPAFMLAAGDDSYYFTRARAALRYSPVDDFLAIDCRTEWKRKFWFRPDVRDWCREMHDRVAAVIPVAYDYRVGYDWSEKTVRTIPFPVDVERVAAQPNRLRNGKLTVFHALNKPGFKGSRHVLAAFDELARRYPGDFEFVVRKPLQFASYMEALRDVNVVVDQTSSYSPGMNALICMALGKVVLSGSEPEARADWGAPDMPVVNVTPSARSVVDALLRLRQRSADFEALASSSRKYVEQTHDCVKIAQRYLDTWSKALR